MALEGELSGLHGVKCTDCGTELPLQVQHSAAGYYLGYFCPNCGPYSRETGYYKAREKAEEELKRWQEEATEPEGVRDTEYHLGKLEVQTFESANKMLAHLIPKDAPQVGPIIPTIAGMAVVNPGTGPCPGATEANAATNVVQLIVDAGLDPDEVGVERHPEGDDEGRFSFLLTLGGYQSEVDMPGWPLEQVRWLDHDSGNIWNFPRLYVDGGSWVWKFATGFVGADLRGEYEDDEDA